MKKLIFTLLFSLFAIVFNVYSQSITGSITDSEDGLPLAGVNIVVQGENRGAVSDFDGNFTIDNSLLKYYTINKRWESEPGDFYVYIGGNSDVEMFKKFELID